MNYPIKYSKAIEFVWSLYRYVTNCSQEKIILSKGLEGDIDKKIFDFYSSKEVEDWLKYVENDISPFFRSDIKLIISKLGYLLNACVKMVLENEMEDSRELIQFIKEMDDSEFLQIIYEEYKLDIPFNSSESEMRKSLAEKFNEETALFFLQIKSHSSEYQSKVIYIFETFDCLYYKPFEDRVYKFMKDRLENHNALFNNSSNEFLNTLGLENCSEIEGDGDNLNVFLNFYLDLGLFKFDVEDKTILFYGHTMDQAFDKKLNLQNTSDLFQVLSDKRRLEIIRVTSKRPWYNKELADYFNLSTATLSYHLNLLLDLGILEYKSEVNNRFYYTSNKGKLRQMINSALKNIIE